ncbi:aspartate/glutamate racemase family protein [uncultured Roseibium sp.]|uniref:maleate cis-trans isomerase family protein n=1 Tax=uncultured Roseibium sp. TaxID=1936171 RepID=UPI002611AD49|nr:aspartate/glutamate racemase family protein [uncultured Roseibium sp.]
MNSPNSNIPRRVGMLTPSSNTVLEPITSSMFAATSGQATVHFARFRVVEISMSDASQAQFELGPILEAADRLAEAKVHCIAWNGTSASWLGLDRDKTLCDQIEDRTGIRATSTMLAFDDLFNRLGVTRLGLVTPYLTEIQERIIANYAAQGIDVVGDRRLEDRGNFSFAEHGLETIRDMIRDVAEARPDAIAVVCTNFRGAPVAAELEAELDIPIIDSIAVTAAHTMHMVGVNPSCVKGWGDLFKIS